MTPGSGSRIFFPDPDPGAEKIPDPDPQPWVRLTKLSELFIDVSDKKDNMYFYVTFFNLSVKMSTFLIKSS